MRISQEYFDELKGQKITAYTLINNNGMEVTSLDFGCIITKLVVPDRDGVLENVVLGFDTIDEYVTRSPYFGAIVGRFAGRIKNAEFTLNNEIYQLVQNDNSNHLHGGLKGFDKVMWETNVVENEDSASLVFSYLSMDGEEGYPGNLLMKVTYTLNNDNELIISYNGKSDQDTLLNMTNHTYFNLSGHVKRNIFNHQLILKSNTFLELDEKYIPTGKILEVNGTPFDFQIGRKIVDGVNSNHPQNILVGNGYDHPFLLNENNNNEILVMDSESGRKLTIETDQPAVVLYTSNQLPDSFSIRGIQSEKYLGLCLETQGLPDSIHHPHFPSSILKKEEVYCSVTKYKFSVY
ncbi:MAG: aldose epimerase family protein [Bacillota bacterium]|nr:aldose epimerase family protein [Bacillota bacterium]